MMAFTKYQIFLSILFIVTGHLNSLSAYWANHAAVVYRADWEYPRRFARPLILILVMFLGEILCLVMFKILRAYYARKHRQTIVGDEEERIIRGSQDFNPLVFLPPAVLDMLATYLMIYGVEMKNSYAAECQMWRGGVVVVLVAYLSRKYVGRTLETKQRRGVQVIFLGFLVIALGSRDRINEEGDEWILISQIILVCQMVYEEKYVVSKDISPLQAVGWEDISAGVFLLFPMPPLNNITNTSYIIGIFGFLILGIALIPLYYAGIEDVPEALDEIVHNWQLPIGLTVIAINIALFNFAGLSIAKELSVTHRMVLDSLRLLWNPIFRNPMQGIGVAIVLRGTMYFYKIAFCSRKEEQPATMNDTDAANDSENNV